MTFLHAINVCHYKPLSSRIAATISCSVVVSTSFSCFILLAKFCYLRFDDLVFTNSFIYTTTLLNIYVQSRRVKISVPIYVCPFLFVLNFYCLYHLRALYRVLNCINFCKEHVFFNLQLYYTCIC